jgi:hypothetical protein
MWLGGPSGGVCGGWVAWAGGVVLCARVKSELWVWRSIRGWWLPVLWAGRFRR